MSAWPITNFSTISIISACVNERISAMLTLVLVCFGSEVSFVLVSVHSYERILRPRFNRIWKKHKAGFRPPPLPPQKRERKTNTPQGLLFLQQRRTFHSIILH